MQQQFHQLSFGGWGDYQTWADNDFLPRPKPPVAEPVEVPPAIAAEITEQVEPETLPAEPPAPPPPPTGFAERPQQYEIEEDLEEENLVVRPYVRTGGRTRVDFDLRMETLLTACAPDPGATWGTSPDLTRLHELCQSPVSVAEISAYLHAPLGVARILISDALAAGLLHVHELTDGYPSMDLLERVHRGLLELA